MLIQEYNDYYRKNPNRWTISERDEMTFEYMSSYGEPKTMLEIGCGTGHLLKCFFDKWPNVAYTGIDYSKVAIMLAKKRVPVEFLCTDVMDYTPVKKFDTILLAGVAEHFDDPAKKLEYICKVQLIRKGIMFMEVPNCIAYRSNKNPEEGYRRIKQGSRQLEWHLARKTWEEIITSAGFTIVETIRGPKQYNEFIWILTHE